MRTITLFCVCVFVSCVEFNDSGYARLNEEEKRMVKNLDCPIEQIEDYQKLYKIRVEQILDFVKKEPYVMVYDYLPFCKSPNVKTIDEIHEFAKQKGAACVVVSSVYDGILPISPDSKTPIFVIDSAPYKTENYQKYSERFYTELTHGNPQKLIEKNIHYFRNGKYMGSY